MKEALKNVNFLLRARSCKLLSLQEANLQQKTALNSDRYQILLKELDLGRMLVTRG